MRVMEIIRRADRHVVDLVVAVASKFVDVAIETLELDKKPRVRKITVDYADGVFRIESHCQRASSIPDRAHVARRDVACRADERKGFCSAQGIAPFWLNVLATSRFG